MKNFLKNFSTLSMLLILSSLSLASCEKDDDNTLRKNIVGEWEIKSFTIDGVEVKGSVVNSSDLEFEEYSGNNGDFEWFISYMDGTSETQKGDYEVDEIDGELILENNNGKRTKFDVEVVGDNLEISGSIDAERYIIKAKRD